MVSNDDCILTNEELVEMVKQNDMKAAGQLYFQNIGMIKKVCNQVCRDRDEFEDYLQQSFIHLVEAANNFDPSKETKFITYMVEHLRGKLFNYRYEKGTDDGLSSLYSMVGEEQDTELIELLGDPEAEFEDNVIEKVAKEELKKALAEVLDELPPDLSIIMKLRLAGKTLKECAEICGISSERVRQKEKAAERLLKRSHYAKRLKPFIYSDDDYLSDGLKGTGLRAWKETGYSSTERAVERIIEKQERWRGNGRQWDSIDEDEEEVCSI